MRIGHGPQVRGWRSFVRSFMHAACCCGAGGADKGATIEGSALSRRLAAVGRRQGALLIACGWSVGFSSLLGGGFSGMVWELGSSFRMARAWPTSISASRLPLLINRPSGTGQ